MNRMIVAALGCAAVACFTASPMAMAAAKSCEALKSEIEAKIQARAVSSYTLEIVPKAEVEDKNMVVGTCDYGRKKIIYQRNDR